MRVYRSVEEALLAPPLSADERARSEQAMTRLDELVTGMLARRGGSPYSADEFEQFLRDMDSEASADDLVPAK